MQKLTALSSEPKQEDVERLTNDLNISNLLAATLIVRGIISSDDARKFLSPKLADLHQPSLLPDYDLAIQAIRKAGDASDKIFVHGDYDVDGVTSAALIARCLDKLGYQVSAKVPHRQQGFGVHIDAVTEAANWGAKLLITCDCGTASLDQVKAAREKGMAVVVTDHHPPPESLPEANAVVNPHRKDSTYPFSDLSGVGVAFKLCLGLSQEHGVQEGLFTDRYLDLATLGTVADVVPLLDENRIIVTNGLPLLWNTKKVGLRKLIDIALNPTKLQRAKSGKDTSPISFQIAPRLNSIGRIDDAGIALSLLMSTDIEEATSLANLIEEKNSERRMEQDRMIDQAIEKLNQLDKVPPYIVVADQSWQPGIAGVVAGRLKDKYGRPALVLGYDCNSNRYRGSIRSIPGIDAGASIQAAEGYLVGGGHPGAAGATLLVEDISKVAQLLGDYVLANLKEEELVPRYFADLKVKLDDIKLDDARDLCRLAPFGEANREPHFLIENAIVKSISPISEGRFTKVFIQQKGGSAVHEMLIWQQFDHVLKALPKDSISILAHLRLNNFRGIESISWSINAWE